MYSPDGQGRYPGGVAGEVRVVRDRDLQVGDQLTFFYPSTEWASPRPFQCLCGAGVGKCIGMQRCYMRNVERLCNLWGILVASR